MSQKVGAMGGNKGVAFDDGVFDGVKKVTVGKDFRNVNYIKIEYEKEGKFEIREHGTNRGRLQEFSVDYPSEYIIAVGGSYDDIFSYGAALIKSLLFKTSYGRTSPILGHTTLLGNPAGKEFMLEGKNGGKFLGFHGRSGEALDAIGPYFSAVDSSLKQFKLQGGDGGFAWDDGAFDGVRKVIVGLNGKSVGYVRFEYAKGQRTVPHAHGHKQEAPQELLMGEQFIISVQFVVDYPNEHITSVEGTIDGYLTSLTFKTSEGRTSPAFGTVVGSRFVFEETGFKLVGIYGRSGNVIDALGAYFAPLPTAPTPAAVPVPAPTPTPIPVPVPAPTSSSSSSLTPPPKKVEAQGGNGGETFDDGAFDAVRKVYVGQGDSGVSYIKFEYEKNGKRETREHGKMTLLGTEEFEVDSDDYITSVECYYEKVFGTPTDIITSLIFKTLKGITSQPFGMVSGDKSILEGGKIVGFHGRASNVLHSLGAYISPSSTLATPNSLKLPAQGGNGGVSWDDGVHDNVRKVYVGQGDSGVAFVKFEYNKGSEFFAGDGHGKKSLLGTEEVYYEKLYGLKTDIITALIFKTFKGITSQPFGMTSGDFFLLEGGKITGFHGSSTDVLHSIGAYMSLSFTPMLRGKWIKVEQKSNEPGPRCSHAIAMVGDKMYSFGGELTPNFHIDQHLYVFDFKTHTWSLAPPNGDVPDLPCLGVCMVATGTNLYVFGGRDGHRNYNGFYSYDTVKSEWKLITHVDKGPAPRSFHAMATDDKNVYVFGGVSTTTRVNTLHAYNIVGQNWTQLPNPGESCKARGGPGLVVVQGKIWVVYGFNGDEVDDVHCYDPAEA
ncbi:hypothetical protein CARUB_v10011659mg [Capsella rubella]|uniref:Jacalin-type lectin domain-containing protein n=1 Tax=Capsella rubella TaxID=81985 RepID=R0I9I6_9BRAS|nr:hypothetical protein CARUB_v10011659mg [Capsella rubella]